MRSCLFNDAIVLSPLLLSDLEPDAFLLCFPFQIGQQIGQVLPAHRFFQLLRHQRKLAERERLDVRAEHDLFAPSALRSVI